MVFVDFIKTSLAPDILLKYIDGLIIADYVGLFSDAKIHKTQITFKHYVKNKVAQAGYLLGIDHSTFEIEFSEHFEQDLIEKSIANDLKDEKLAKKLQKYCRVHWTEIRDRVENNIYYNFNQCLSDVYKMIKSVYIFKLRDNPVGYQYLSYFVKKSIELQNQYQQPFDEQKFKDIQSIFNQTTDQLKVKSKFGVIPTHFRIF